MVTLDDSDEEYKTDTSSDSEFEIDVTDLEGESAEEKLKIFINQTLNSKFDIDSHLNNVIDDIKERVEANEQAKRETDELFNQVEKDLDNLRKELYEPFKPPLKELATLDMNDPQNVQNKIIFGRMKTISSTEKPKAQLNNSDIQSVTSIQSSAQPTALPPVGPLEKPKIKAGDIVYAMRGNILNVWKSGKVMEVNDTKPESIYKLRFESFDSKGSVKHQSKSLFEKHLAYLMPSKNRFPVGTRIIAVYKDPMIGDSAHSADFYSGIVAEPPKLMNKYRYLIFFDDGYASYIPHKDIRVVAHQSTNVWEDVHSNNREFIKKYLMQYPERPMVKLTKGQVVRTELNGKWWLTSVEEVDASLVRLFFKSDGKIERVYRGSTRLGPLFMELQQQKAKKGQVGSTLSRRTPHRKSGVEPYVEYTRHTDLLETTEPVTEQPKKPTARKSTGQKRAQLDQIQSPSQPKTLWESRGKKYLTSVEKAEGKKFIRHQCGPQCVSEKKYQYNESAHKKYNPLLIPIILGWKRILVKTHNLGRRTIVYIAPCGRRLRSLQEIHRYLRLTELLLEMDFFNFEWFVKVMEEFKAERELCVIPDISYGKENVPVSCINSLDKNYPEYVEYSCVRLPQKNVEINTDPNFLVCCDCDDDCRDKNKCSCAFLTRQNTTSNPGGIMEKDVGYNFKRLKQQVPSGIFECNSKCKCKATCLNRVAQKPLRSKLQVFKTERRGWGIRTLCDIPEGSFICIYVGNLYSNNESNSVGQNYGDEYFAELDMIETLEGQKEGYESDVLSDCEDLSPFDEKDESPASTEDEDVDITPDKEDRAIILPGIQPTSQANDRVMRSRKSKGGAKNGYYAESQGSNSGDEAFEEDKRRELKGFGVSKKTDSNENKEKKEKFISTRKLYGKDEEVYVMDAKAKGNIGRYLNHSCQPNVFVQNCFVDTHDLRFPWLAFFASSHIDAGKELCWDYNYIVDQVEGKEILCNCGAETCRGRLL